MQLTLVSRPSELSLVQARMARDRIEELTSVDVELTTTESAGDQNKEKSLDRLDNPGFFTRSLDQMVVDGEVNAAVHSLKDCPAQLPPSLDLAAFLPRVNYHDVLVGPRGSELPEIKPGLTVGTGSARRKANLLHEEPALEVVSCRGNVPTRLEKLEAEATAFEALVLSEIGLDRLQLDAYPKRRLSPGIMLPAPGQGTIVLTCRSDAKATREVLNRANHHQTAAVCTAERAFLAGLDGGCGTPAGALGEVVDGELQLRASLTQPAGNDHLQVTKRGTIENPRELGEKLAEELLAAGGRRWLTD